MALTSKQELFAQCVASGKSQSDAYRAAYDVREDTNPLTTNNDAYKLMQNPDISARVEELKEELSKKYLWTREDSVRELVSRLSNAKDGDAFNAIKILNEMHGYNEPTKTEHSGIIKFGWEGE